MLTELRPKKELLDPNFSGYKLSLEPIPVYRQNIKEGVDHVCQSEDQYSFIHTKVFSLHNHLFRDPWHENSVFFVDKTWQLLTATVSTLTGRLDDIEAVWSIPHITDREAGHYNISLQFPTKDLAVLSDGCGRLYVLKRLSEWQPELSSDLLTDGGNLLVSARLATDSTLHCVLMTLESVNHEETTEAESKRSDMPPSASIITVLNWLALKKDIDGTGMWRVTCTRRLEGAGSLDYIAIEPSCQALYLASNTNFKFTADSENPLPPPIEKTDTHSLPVYTWQQSKDDIKVLVEVGAEASRDDVEVVVRDKDLSVEYCKNIVVTGTLYHAVDNELTTWSLQEGKLELILWKREPGLMWAQLLIGDKKGQQIYDPAVVDQVHSHLSHLCSDSEVKESGEGVAPTFNLDQLEECDSAPEESRSLVRLDANTHDVSHYISLAGHQWLMTVALESDSVPCVCVRHDVDGCVWQIEPPSLPLTKDWPCQHIGTFFAFGYVAASKQQRKFTLAAPDLSYTVICEASNHVFVYRKATNVNGELRNRKTSAKVSTVAKQQLINLESQSPILGAHASIHYLFILTSDTLYTFHIQ